VTPTALLAELQNRGATLTVVGDRLRLEAPESALNDELLSAVAAHKPEILQLLSMPALNADAGELAAVKLRNTVIGDVWLVADAEALAEHPDIIRSGLPVFWFDELEMLRGKTPAELKAIGMVKATFPTGRVLQ
jgi:hypothetical protein